MKAGIMAVYSPYDTMCAICEDDLSGKDDNVTTSRFITDRTHPLYRFSDTVMHRACFMSWEHREAFVRASTKTPIVASRSLAWTSAVPSSGGKGYRPGTER